MTNFLTVDQTTWKYIKQQFRPAYDKKSGDYFINCRQIRQLRINFHVQSTTNNTRLMLPATDIVQQTVGPNFL
jgi:hypothetical protein